MNPIKRFALALLFVVLVLHGFASAQEPQAASLEDQLLAHYQLVKLGPDGKAVIEPGTVLKVVIDTQVDSYGDYALVVAPNISLCPYKFVNGKLKNAAMFCALKNLIGVPDDAWHRLELGERVYPSQIEVAQDKDRVTMRFVECDSCNGVAEPSTFKAEIAFQFAKGSLRTASVQQVMDTISEVLAFDEDADTAQNQAMPAPPTIELGQSIEQVVAALGQPEKIVNLAEKRIYVYKDLKVTFLNGKVSDVQ